MRGEIVLRALRVLPMVLVERVRDPVLVERVRVATVRVGTVRDLDLVETDLVETVRDPVRVGMVRRARVTVSAGERPRVATVEEDRGRDRARLRETIVALVLASARVREALVGSPDGTNDARPVRSSHERASAETMLLATATA
jgi:hypothetical protein